MANMFTGKSKKQIPKTLSECVSPDATATNLHYWSEKLENWGQILFVILIIIGIISTIVDTVNMSDVNEDMAFATFLSSAITWALYAFIEYCAYHVLALLISALASITQNTIISANVALYESAKSEGFPQDITENIPSPNAKADKDLTCESAVSANENTPQPKEWQPVAETTAIKIGQTNIKCLNCDCVQFGGNKFCKRCGAKITEIIPQQ